MALHGKVILISKGVYGFEHISTYSDQPKQSRMVWRLENCKTSGMSWFDVNSVPGKEATCTDALVKAYVGNGNWFSGLIVGGSNGHAEIVETTDLPCPKVRKGIQTRYNNGRWQKYLKSEGWIAA